MFILFAPYGACDHPPHRTNKHPNAPFTIMSNLLIDWPLKKERRTSSWAVWVVEIGKTFSLLSALKSEPFLKYFLGPKEKSFRRFFWVS